MNTVHYDIRDFKWVEETKTLYGDGFDLYDAEAAYKQPFPNGRSQFVIKNYKTKGFRRFVFQSETTDPFGTYYVYTSEDGIRCIINLD
jgi:hypothetical protein